MIEIEILCPGDINSVGKGRQFAGGGVARVTISHPDSRQGEKAGIWRVWCGACDLFSPSFGVVG
jgi:hypothetical protein